MPPIAEAKAEWLKASADGRPIGVDRNEEVIRGMIVAQEGPFKSEGRGEFDKDALKSIVKMIKASPNGLKSRLSHPDMSNDGIGKFLGRIRNPWLDVIGPRDSAGELKTDEITVVRADLHLDPSSHNTPSGDIGSYVMDLAESDSDALSNSLVLRVEEEYRIDKQGRRLQDEDGVELPPLWRPIRLHASDIVDTGDAVDGLLSVEDLPDAVVRKAASLMDQQFAGKTREFVEARCAAWLSRYLDRRYGLAANDVDELPPDEPGEPVAEVPPIEAAIEYDPAHDPDIRKREIQTAEV